jgi:hypothetical protein
VVQPNVFPLLQRARSQSLTGPVRGAATLFSKTLFAQDAESHVVDVPPASVAALVVQIDAQAFIATFDWHDAGAVETRGSCNRCGIDSVSEHTTVLHTANSEMVSSELASANRATGVAGSFLVRRVNGDEQ